MKPLCISSCGNGHIDFGGMGFVKLAQTLQDHGHDVHWLAHPNNSGLLREKAFRVIQSPLTDMYQLNPFFSVDDIPANHELFKGRLRHLELLLELFEHVKPDVILLDRILPLCQLAAAQIDIPSVAVGTPGGDWSLDDSIIHGSAIPVDAYRDLGEAFKSELGWKSGTLSSVWVNSEYLNVCFTGKSMFEHHGMDYHDAAFVHHYTRRPEDTQRDRIGVSFGNSGTPSWLARVMEYALSAYGTRYQVEVFSGKDQELYDSLQAYFGKRINLHEWVNFNDVFPALMAVIYHGGIGTTWNCINHSVPMLIVPGGIGDQPMNGLAVECLGMGACIDFTKLDDAAFVYGKLEKVMAGNACREKLIEFKRKENYTDTLASVAERITGILHGTHKGTP